MADFPVAPRHLCGPGIVPDLIDGGPLGSCTVMQPEDARAILRHDAGLAAATKEDR